MKVLKVFFLLFFLDCLIDKSVILSNEPCTGFKTAEKVRFIGGVKWSVITWMISVKCIAASTLQ